MFCRVKQELTLDRERTSRELHFGFTLRFNLKKMVPKESSDVTRIAGRSNRRHRPNLRYFRCGGEHSRTTEAMTDQNRRCLMR